ncbi:hypothetical protein CPB84DRAFT_1743799 [Gymnopilus junonius]|uniref:Uncharacterized protein n=1 Tax=Gymnopilus junonius TaxID=109634 RepID=A0A9P5NZI5_GYMJU|nr:hypothetical protein CPB84DRAFT_1743799 [Gymnopilus junonius]
MPHKDSPSNIPDFEKKTLEKLTHYYVVGYKCHLKLQPWYAENKAGLAQVWKARERDWHANHENPSTFPQETLTLKVVNDYYAKCDALCDREPSTDNPGDLIHIYFASNNGASFISLLLNTINHPARLEILRDGGNIALKAFFTPQQIRDAEAGGNSDARPPSKVSPGDVLHYQDTGKANMVRTVRIKDHCNSAMKGEFFIVTTIVDEDQDDDTADRVVPADEMEEWVQQRVQIG